MRSVVLDTETTGLEPKQGHKIVEIGAVELVNRKPTGKTLHYYLQPDLIMDEEVIKIHGITNDFLLDKPHFADISDKFFEFIKGSELIIHNAEFDLKFIRNEFELINQIERSKITDYCTVFDTLMLARKMFPGQRNNLDALCKRYGVDNSKREVHGALLDAELLVEVYLLMTGGQATLNIDANQSNAFHVKELDSTKSNYQHIPTKIIYANAEEVSQHEQFLQSINKQNK